MAETGVKQVKVPEDLHYEVRGAALEDRRTVMSITEEALRDWMTKRTKRIAKVRGVA